MKTVFTPRELADALAASESSVRRWVDAGTIRMSRTVGGHRRIPLGEALRFIRQTRATVVRPEILGLGELDAPAASVDQKVYDAMAAGDAARLGGLLLSLYAVGQSVAAICDGPLRGGLHRVGELWLQDEPGILIEHAATDAMLQALNQFRQVLPPVAATAATAIGAAPEGDFHMIATSLAALVLADAGYRVMNYGANTPLRLLAAAAKQHGARLVWVSVTVPQKGIAEELADLARRQDRRGARLVVGGQSAAGLAPIVGCEFVQSMTELSAYARGLLGKGK